MSEVAFMTVCILRHAPNCGHWCNMVCIKWKLVLSVGVGNLMGLVIEISP